MIPKLIKQISCIEQTWVIREILQSLPFWLIISIKFTSYIFFETIKIQKHVTLKWLAHSFLHTQHSTFWPNLLKKKGGNWDKKTLRKLFAFCELYKVVLIVVDFEPR